MSRVTIKAFLTLAVFALPSIAIPVIDAHVEVPAKRVVKRGCGVRPSVSAASPVSSTAAQSSQIGANFVGFSGSVSHHAAASSTSFQVEQTAIEIHHPSSLAPPIPPPSPAPSPPSSSAEPSSTASSLPQPSSPGGGGGGSNGADDGSSGDAQIDQFLNLHNTFRAEYGAGKVTWNTTMAQFAADAANTCNYGHTGGPYGENIAAGVGGGYNITSAFDSWANEASLYNWNSPGYQESTGHFTQIVWKGTTQIGCAMASCADNTIFDNYGQNSLYVVCEYAAAGNIVGNNGEYFKLNVGIKI
ncbi:CAP domain-containing protein [Kockovaella imperatae]|uniref:CAP domain-containing protein n=1 Tax=Kockovaella imperatae TaxID=4999 RepID=A0A1Y1UJX5_9TREE|nr:CAP domain-containing protein [Kockovaella imperatae]ORX37827.1 CAP domain-containing protein [Kockovaella imperatae]